MPQTFGPRSRRQAPDASERARRAEWGRRGGQAKGGRNQHCISALTRQEAVLAWLSGMTQEEAAAEFGVSASGIRRWHRAMEVAELQPEEGEP